MSTAKAKTTGGILNLNEAPATSANDGPKTYRVRINRVVRLEDHGITLSPRDPLTVTEEVKKLLGDAVIESEEITEDVEAV